MCLLAIQCVYNACERPCTHVKDPLIHVMSEVSGLWKHKNNQHALVPLKTECGCPSGEGIKNGHIRYPSQSYEWRNAEERKKGKCHRSPNIFKTSSSSTTCYLNEPEENDPDNNCYACEFQKYTWHVNFVIFV